MIKKIAVFFIIMCFVLLAPGSELKAFESDSFFAEEEGPEFSYSGEIYPEYRSFIEQDGKGVLNLALELLYENENFDIETLIEYSSAHEEIELTEAFFQYYAGENEILLGKKMLVWGKGDQVHIVDQINGEDMRDFINPDYLDRQLGEDMLKWNHYLKNGQALLEFVYTPEFTPHKQANDPDSSLGNWLMNPFATMSLADISVMTGLSQTEIMEEVESAFPEYKDQFALRYTDSKEGLDYGFTYYHGYLREAAFNKEILLNAAQNPGQINENSFKQLLEMAELHYDRLDMFGVEMASIWEGINSRMELAYFRTEDVSGDDPFIRNNKIVWLLGGDRDLSFSNLNLNIQLTGEKILGSSEIEENSLSDLQYDEEGEYSKNRLIVNLEDNYQNESIVTKLSWVYNLNDEDYMLEGGVDYKVNDDTVIKVFHKLFYGEEDTIFGQFADNDFTSLGLEYTF